MSQVPVFTHEDRPEASVVDARQAARSVVARLEGQVMFAKLYNNTTNLGLLWNNCLALLGAAAPATAPAPAPVSAAAAA